jgi:hypothetical protein
MRSWNQCREGGIQIEAMAMGGLKQWQWGNWKYQMPLGGLEIAEIILSGGE